VPSHSLIPTIQTDARPNRVQVTIQINAPGHALDEEFLPLDADISSTLATLKTQVHDGTGFPITSIQFFLNGAPVVGDDKTLEQAGITTTGPFQQ
jgi:hypothetical protein